MLLWGRKLEGLFLLLFSFVAIVSAENISEFSDSVNYSEVEYFNEEGNAVGVVRYAGRSCSSNLTLERSFSYDIVGEDIETSDVEEKVDEILVSYISKLIFTRI